ncbi:hypothetical protein SBOR_8628 [Sclerotinia borealis F-4128]|uniref:2EXR domain-containing protein n=1 Tax=Sclerotinia borealis (strain F-4128) TaxID=1432307 RepID=W9C7Z3_SCLBF|nr:hypothetical protein SBOR_8628 [Sclerotinia borealis F-4128]
MAFYTELLIDLQDTLGNIMRPRFTSIRVITRPRSQTLPANFAPFPFSTKASLSSLASNPENNDGEMKSDQVLRGTDLFRTLLDYSGMEAVRKKLVGFFRLDKYGADSLRTIVGKYSISDPTDTREVGTKVDDEGKFGLFRWLPMEVKLKILTYAFDDPRIVSVSCKQLKHNASCHGHTRLVYSGPQDPYLYVSHLTRFQALQHLHNLIQYNTLHIGCKAFPTIKYNPVSDTIWIREIDFWSSSNKFSCSLTLPSRNRALHTLAITTSSNKAIMDQDNLYRLSCILSHWFRGVQELIVIVDHLDFTTPGVRDEIAFVHRKSKLLPKHRIVTKYSPAISSLSVEFIEGLLFGEWKPEHWSTLVSSLKKSFMSSFMESQEIKESRPNPFDKVSAIKVHVGLLDWKSRLESLNGNGEEGRGKMIENFRSWRVPTIKLLAAATRKQLEGKDHD